MPTEIGKITLYSTDELSEKLNVTVTTLRRYIKNGNLKARKVGGRWFISEEALREFFKGSDEMVSDDSNI